MKVSVIIPVYGVEKFIAQCAETLFGQTLADVEYIFVDDATKDNSIVVLESVLERFPERREQVRIVHHEMNKGLPAARNTGLSYAIGQYVFHCDGDDFMESDMLESLLTVAEENDADIVWSDWYLSFEKNERYMKQPSFSNPMEALKAMLSGVMKYNVWNKLARRSLYSENGIRFPDGYGMGEDMTMMMLFACADKVAYCPKALYHYVKLNTGAFSQTYSERHLIDLKFNVQRISDYIQNKFGDNLNMELAFLKLDAKFPFLISDGSNGRYRRWKEWYPEANEYIMRNTNLSLRSRLVQWFAWKNQWWVVWLYYQVVIRFVYSVLYR